MDTTITWEARSSKAGTRDLARAFPVAIGLVGILLVGTADVVWPPPFWAWLLLVPFFVGCLMNMSSAFGARVEVAKVYISRDGVKVVATRSAVLFAKRERIELDFDWSDVLAVRAAQEIVLDGGVADVVHIDLARETVLGRCIELWMFASKRESEAWAASATGQRPYDAGSPRNQVC